MLSNEIDNERERPSQPTEIAPQRRPGGSIAKVDPCYWEVHAKAYVHTTAVVEVCFSTPPRRPVKGHAMMDDSSSDPPSVVCAARAPEFASKPEP